MASIRIRNKSGSGGIPSGLTQGELAVNLADAVLWVGGTLGNSIFLSGVQSFNGLTGHVWGVTTSTPNTFAELNTFLKGISASGATLGTLIVHRGISAAGGVTFHNNVWVSGQLNVVEGIEASGGVTFANTLYVGETLSVATDISYNGKLVKNGIPQYTMQSVGTTSDLQFIVGATVGDIVFVNGPTGWDGLYVLRRPNTSPPQSTNPLWSRLNGNLPADVNGDGVVNGNDLGVVLAQWGNTQDVYEWSGTPLLMGISDNEGDAFEVKVYGAASGKKSSALKITSNEAVPQIFMKAGTVDVDGGIKVVDYTTGVDQVALIQGSYFANYPILRVRAENISGTTVGGWSEFICGVCFAGGITFSAPVFMGASAPVRMGGLLTLNSGLSAGCGVTFNCLTHFRQGLSASGATLGTLVVNGGATFNGPVYMGTTLTMNSNIRFNSGFGIFGGFVDGGTYN